jgi:hypothetical protein
MRLGQGGLGTDIVVTQPFFADKARPDWLSDNPKELNQLIKTLHFLAWNYEGIR